MGIPPPRCIPCHGVAHGSGNLTVEEATDTRHYRVAGATWSQLEAAMQRLGPTRGSVVYPAYTDWRITWRYRPDPTNATLSLIHILSRTTITFPEWRAPTSVPPELHARWRRFRAELHHHEHQHVATAQRAVQALVVDLEPWTRRPHSEEGLLAIETVAANVERHGRRRDLEVDEHG